LLSIASSINRIDEKFFEVHDELCIHAIVDKFVYEDSKNNKLFVVLDLEDSHDTRSSTEDLHHLSSFSDSR
jgi:hypothetical protein